MQPEGQAEQPRVSLLSVPYALRAADAQTVGGLPASAFVLAAPPSSDATSGAIPSAATQPLAGTTPVTIAVQELSAWYPTPPPSGPTQSHALVLGGTGVRVGIGTSAPSNVFTIAKGAGSAIADGWTTYSSRRWYPQSLLMCPSRPPIPAGSSNSTSPDSSLPA